MSYATEFKDTGEAFASHQDEVCGRSWMPMDECVAMMSSGVIVGSLSVIALPSVADFRQIEVKPIT